MNVTVGTFNLNNLFSRYNFQAKVEGIPDGTSGGVTLTFDQGDFSVRTFQGRLVSEKSQADRNKVAERILTAMDVDVLAVQEVEHIEILKQFNRDHLNGLYDHAVLVEGNDPRLIDVGILSKYPIGPITSHQTAVHPNDTSHRVFGRDLLQVDILDHNRNKLFTLYNTHMKSHYVPYDQDPVQGAARANERRQRQAEVIKSILERTESATGKYVLVGDMNDPPDSPYLAPMLTIHGHDLVNALEQADETRPPKQELAGQGPGPQTKVWTHRFNPPGPPLPEYALYDQIWVSPTLAGRFANAMIDRREHHGGDGSDHDPAWVEIDV